MVNSKNHRLMSFISMLLSVVMVLASTPLYAFGADVITQGLWTITNDGSNGSAEYNNIGFVYHSFGSSMKGGNIGKKDYVQSISSNGYASNNIVLTEETHSGNVSYCDFTPDKDGTLTVDIRTASGKTGYVSRTNTETGENEAIGSYTPSGSEADNVDTEGFKVTQGDTGALLEIEVEEGYKYYVNLVGSKMWCFGAEYTPYTTVTGNITNTFEGLTSYLIKFVNSATGEATEVTVTDNKYSVNLKPGEYSVAIADENAASYAITQSTRLVTVNAQADTETVQTHDLAIEKSISYVVSGNITGISESHKTDDMKLVFVPDDTTSFPSVTAEIAGTTYSARLVAGQRYTLRLEGANDHELAGEIAVSNDNGNPVTQNVALKMVTTHAVNGKFLGLTQVRGEYETLNVNPTAIKFTNVDDKYEYSGTVSNGTYSVSLRNGSYVASITLDGYSTTTHVVVNNGAVTRDLLLKDENPGEVAYSATLEVGQDKAYKSVQAAVNAVSRMSRPNGERVTIMIDPGTYREQVIINTPDITLESNGGSADDTVITWYYGIGYKYYSAVDSHYDPYADYDKFTKGDVTSDWGAAVVLESSASGFRAENIKFENSFNKYMTDEEIADGVAVDSVDTTTITLERNESTDADSRAATERAAALVNYADEIEFNDCSFIGSQDTLYTGNRENLKSYYKNCYIEGQTDFIYGNGDVIFDGCEINFCGYDGTASAGYITANSSSEDYPAEAGYIFRGCYISYNQEREVTAGYLGRMWGDSAKVAFINTQLQESDMITGAGWYAMSVEPTAPTVTLTEYNTTYNGVKVDTSERVNGVKESINASDYSVESVFTANGWTPTYYTADAITSPQFDTQPNIVQGNGDLNTPNPGEKVNVSYSLGSEWADEDASIIAWYAVDAYHESSEPLDTVLQGATLLGVNSAVTGVNEFQVPMECAGKYLMVVVTPVTVSGLTGTPQYKVHNAVFSNNWVDPSNPGSIAPGSGVNIYLAGDSTVKDYSANGMYNGGSILSAGSWGEYLQYFFDDTDEYVTINNYAQGGRSLRSFLNEGSFDRILENIKEGDYLFIQFGHNDSANGESYYEDRFVPLFLEGSYDDYPEGTPFPTIVPEESMKKDTPPSLDRYGDKYYAWDSGATYKGYIQYYIDAALEKGAIPVIVSPVARMYYNSSGDIRPHHDATETNYAPTAGLVTENNSYVRACEELYEENIEKGNNVLYMDAFQMTVDMYEAAYDACGSAANGNDIMDYTDRVDATHSNKTGGVIEAGLVAKWIQDQNLDKVSEYVVQPVSVYGEEPSHEHIFDIDAEGNFTARNKNLVENEYWNEYGQKLFDSIGGKETPEPEPVNEVSLVFNTDEAMNLYTATDTYTDGVYTGKYTNESSQEFDVSIYESGISYFENDSRYGVRLLQTPAANPSISFTADKPGTYTVSVTRGTAGTAALYSSADMSTAAATLDLETNASGDLVYNKTSEGAETIYIAAASNNLYVADISISYTEPEVPDAVTLNFATAEALALYETNADATYTDGVYTGVYTNESGQTFTASIYQSGIQYYNSDMRYGTKANERKPVFSFIADGSGLYTITSSAGTGSGTVDLYTEDECINSVASGNVDESFVYRKETDAPETLYFAASVSSNLYLSNVTITKADIPDDVMAQYTGTVTGIEADDTNVMLTIQNSSGSVNISAEEYAATGTQLVTGGTYEVTAKGDKGVYTGTLTVPETGNIANITVERIVFDFPLNFMGDNYNINKLYLNEMGYGSGEVTDPYSGITVHPNGVVMTDSLSRYGVKTNANDIISFTAKQTGAVTVSVIVNTSNADTFTLKVNGVNAPVLADAPSGNTVNMTVMVNEGDTVTINTPSRSNLWYEEIDVTYSNGSFIQVDAVRNGDEIMMYGSIPTEYAGNVSEVGFCYTDGTADGLSGLAVADFTDTVFGSIVYNNSRYNIDGSYVWGTVLTDISETAAGGVSTVYVYTYCKTVDGNTYYSAPVAVSLQ